MLILLILTFILIYIHLGLLVVTQIIIWTLVYFISDFLIKINPSREMLIIKIMSIIVIIFILYWNRNHTYIITSFIIPLSVNKRTFIDDLEIEPNPNDIYYIRKCYITWFHFNDFK
jgi:hypothetical protein